MMLVNLLKEKEIVYDVDSTENLKSANFVLTLDGYKVYNYPGKIDNKNKTITINLPPLQDIAKEGTPATCYLELQDLEGLFHKVEQNEIEFKNIPVISLKFHETTPQPPTATRRNVDEIFLTGKRVVTEKRKGPIPRNIVRQK